MEAQSITAQPSPINLGEGWLTERQTAELLRCSVSKLQQDRFLRKGIPYIKLGRSVRYAPADIQDFMDAHKVNLQ